MQAVGVFDKKAVKADPETTEEIRVLLDTKVVPDKIQADIHELIRRNELTQDRAVKCLVFLTDLADK